MDRLAREVLAAIESDGDGMMDTVNVREKIQADDNKRVKYRFDKLEEAGLIEVERDRKEGSRSLPNRAEITPSGEELVDTYELEFGVANDSDETLRKRVARSEREREDLQDDIESLFRVLGVLFREQGIDVEGVSRVGVDPHRLRPAGERGDGE